MPFQGTAVHVDPMKTCSEIMGMAITILNFGGGWR